MPELPEVETTRRGIEPYVVGVKIRDVIVRRGDLRQPVSADLPEVAGHTVQSVTRRSKYLLIEIDDGSTLLIHLGMSGSLRVIQPEDDWKKHDHVAITLANGKQLRFHDPRRFGLVLRVASESMMDHPLLKSLGPEPLEDAFHAEHLARVCEKKSAAIKLVIMDAKTVVGVGNIYASEALFRAGILPQTAANRLSRPKLKKLVSAIRDVLSDSIREGGTTLRDFLQSDGEPGYFKQRLFVYDRKAESCRVCGALVKHAVLGQRATYWCSTCQR